MPTQITAYKAKDGTLFTDKQSAFAHDQAKDLNKLLRDEDHYWRGAHYMVSHKNEILEILLRTC